MYSRAIRYYRDKMAGQKYNRLIPFSEASKVTLLGEDKYLVNLHASYNVGSGMHQSLSTLTRLNKPQKTHRLPVLQYPTADM